MVKLADQKDAARVDYFADLMAKKYGEANRESYRKLGLRLSSRELEREIKQEGGGKSEESPRANLAPASASDTTLRDYQWQAIQDLSQYLIEGERKLVLEMPTGAGKSVVIAALMAGVAKTKLFKSAVVATPFITIREAFAANKQVWTVPPSLLPKVKGSSVRSVEFDMSDLWLGREADESHLYSHVRGTPGNFALPITQAALRRWSSQLPSDLTGRLLVIDEAHHVDDKKENDLTKVVDLWLARGGTVLHVTATPFRGQGQELFSEEDGWQPHRRTIAEHAQSLNGGKGMHFALERRTLGTASTTQQIAGLKHAKKGEDERAVRWADFWVKDGKPKAVCIVPPDASREWGAQLERLLTERGARVFNAVGCERERAEDLVTLLGTERNVKRYGDSRVDVILACKRFDEGTDWPLCSHVYNYGLPSTYGLVIQRWGRAFRDKSKIDGYPATFAEQAKIVFLVPQVEKDLALEFERKTHNAHMLIACFMHDFKTAAQYAVPMREPGEGVEGIRARQKMLITDLQRAKAQELLLRAELKGPKSGAEWVAWIDSKACPVELRAACKAVLGDRLRSRGRSRARGERLRTNFDEHFEQVAAEFKDKTVLFDEVVKVITTFTGETPQELGKRLVGARGETSLAEAFPELASQWHPTKNGTVGPNDVSRSSGFRAWWICSTDPSHVWDAKVSSRVAGISPRGHASDCPICAGQSVIPGTSLATLHPELVALQWDPSNTLDPLTIAPSSNQIAQWRCAAGHVWKERVRARVRGSTFKKIGRTKKEPRAGIRCRMCHPHNGGKSLAAHYPTLMSEWDADRNAQEGVSCDNVKTNQRYWWKCVEGHSWQSLLGNRASGKMTGCPVCFRARQAALRDSVRDRVVELHRAGVSCVEITKAVGCSGAVVQRIMAEHRKSNPTAFHPDWRGKSTLTDTQVIDARRRYGSAQDSIAGLSREFGVAGSTLEAAIRGKTHVHLPDAVPAGVANTRRINKLLQSKRYAIGHNSGNRPVGARNNKTKLSWEQVCEARTLYEAGQGTSTSLAQKYSVSQSSMHAILTYTTRKLA